MAVTDDILATYRAPRAVTRRLLAAGTHEGRAATFLIAALLLFFVAQWPGLQRAAVLDPSVPYSQRIFAAFLAALATVPAFYLLAALGHLAARALGGRGSFHGARVTLFWSLLAVAPLVLLQGLVAAFIGPGPQATLMGGIVFAVFLWFWLSGLAVVEFGDGA